MQVQPKKCEYVKFAANGISEGVLKIKGMTFNATDRSSLLGMDIHACRIFSPQSAQVTRNECAKQRLARCMKLPCARRMKHAVIVAMVASLWKWTSLEPTAEANYRKAMRVAVMDTLETKDRPWELAFE
eukprot:2371089-Amphidinium_carterae.1